MSTFFLGRRAFNLTNAEFFDRLWILREGYLGYTRLRLINWTKGRRLAVVSRRLRTSRPPRANRPRGLLSSVSCHIPRPGYLYPAATLAGEIASPANAVEHVPR